MYSLQNIVKDCSTLLKQLVDFHYSRFDLKASGNNDAACSRGASTSRLKTKRKACSAH